jgi:hypothetical protein
MRKCILRDNANSEFIIKASDNKIEISAEGLEFGDEYHTMHELYQHRMALTIALFNTLNEDIMWGDIEDEKKVIKSKLHHDGTMFEGGYFIVMAITSVGQISYHYHLKHWDKFRIPEVERAPQWDGHTSLDVLGRLEKI